MTNVIALVTGGGSGVGKSMAVHLPADGWTVVITRADGQDAGGDGDR